MQSSAELYMNEYYVEERRNAFMFSIQNSKLDMQLKLHMKYKEHACPQQSSGSSCKCTSKSSFWQPNHLTVAASYKCIGLTYILSIPKPVPDWNTSTHRGPEAFQCDHWKWVEKPIRSSSQYQSLQDPVILHVAATHAKKDMLASLSCSHSQCFCATYWSPLFIFKHDGALCMASKQYLEHHQQLSVAVLYRLFKWQLCSHFFIVSASNEVLLYVFS